MDKHLKFAFISKIPILLRENSNSTKLIFFVQRKISKWIINGPEECQNAIFGFRGKTNSGNNFEELFYV